MELVEDWEINIRKSEDEKVRLNKRRYLSLRNVAGAQLFGHGIGKEKS